MKQLKIIVTVISFLALILLSSCATTAPSLNQAKTNFGQHNYGAAFKQTSELAKQGNAEAQYALGYLYYYGLGTFQDQDLARKWISAAAKQGYQPAEQAFTMLTSTNKASTR